MKKIKLLLIFSSVAVFIDNFAFGQAMFQKVIGGTGGNEESYYSTMTSDSGHVMVGYSDGFGSGGEDFYLVKTNAAGDLLWSKTYGGVGVDIANYVQQTADNGYVLVGSTNSFGAGLMDIIVVKTDSVGDTIWTRTYGGVNNDYGYCIKQTTDGGYVLAGYTNSYGAGFDDCYVIKTDSNGDTLWTKTYGNTNYEYAYSIQQTLDSGYIITGETYSFGAGNGDAFLIKTNALGDTLWTKAYGGDSMDIGLSVLETPGANYLVAGYTFSFGAPNGDAYVLSLDASGNPQWSMAYGGVLGDAAYSFEPLADGGYAVGGYSYSLSGGDADYYLIHTDSSGSSGTCYENTAATVVSFTATVVGNANFLIGSGTIANNGSALVTTPSAVSRLGFSISLIGSTDNVCSYDSVGTATVSVTGGTLNYTYLWDDYATQTTAMASNLPGGSYEVVVTDGWGCQDSVSVIIFSPMPITLAITDTNHLTCNGAANGSATVSVSSGGVGQITYLWDDPSSQTDSAAINLSGGLYTVTVSDSTACTDSISVTINEPAALSVSLSSTIFLVCNSNSSASATASVFGGTTPYTYLWNDPSAQTDSTAINLATGAYQVIVTDGSGCTQTDSISIGLIASISSSSVPVCGGICNGTATVTATGGNTPYTYSWNTLPSQTTSTASNLCGGSTFTATVTDVNGCTSTAVVTFPLYTPLSITITTININCFGNTNGSAIAIPTGGSAPFIYVWPSLGTTGSVQNNLAAGAYTVIVTDGNGCSKTATATITAPSAALTSSIVNTPVTCKGSSNGVANLSVSGGTSPYTYLWQGGVTTQDTAGLSEGSFIVTVTDSKACTTIDTAVITSPSALMLSGSSLPDSGTGTGKAWVVASGGNTTYTYIWDDNQSQTTDTAVGLLYGVYTVVVTDNKGCSDNLGVAVSNLNSPAFQNTYEGALNDLARGVVELSGGGFAVAGFSESFGAGGTDAYLVVTDKNGNLMWAKSYGGSLDDGANSVQQTSDGGFILAGYSLSYGAGSYDAYLVKTDNNGNVQWSQTYGGTGDDRAYAIAEISGGGYIIAGGTKSFGAGNTDVYLIQVNASGAVQWTKAFGGTGFDYGYSVQQTSDGGYIVAGYTYSFGAGNADVYLIKTNATGTSQWTKVVGGSKNDVAWSVLETSVGGFALAGYSMSFGGGEEDVYFIKTDNSGNVTVSRTFGGSGVDIGYAIAESSDGGFAISGSSSSFTSAGNDAYLIKTNAAGDLFWSKTFGGTFNDHSWAIQTTSDNGYILAGNSTSYGSGLTEGVWEMYLLKTDAGGNSGCNEKSVTSSQADTSGSVSSGGLAGSGGVAGSAATTAMASATVTDILCFKTTGIYSYRFNDNNQIAIYPNPSNGRFMLSMSVGDGNTPLTIRIFDMHGRIVTQETLIGEGTLSLPFDLGEVQKGMYYVQIISANEVVARKIIVQ